MDARIRDEYRHMWSDLFTFEDLDAMRKWTNALGMQSRVQPYGDPVDTAGASAHGARRDRAGRHTPAWWRALDVDR